MFYDVYMLQEFNSSVNKRFFALEFCQFFKPQMLLYTATGTTHIGVLRHWNGKAASRASEPGIGASNASPPVTRAVFFRLFDHGDSWHDMFFSFFFCVESFFCWSLFQFTLWWTNSLQWKITMLLMGKSTINIYKWPFSIVFCMFTRG